MHIEFFYKDTGKVIDNADYYYFVMNDNVYRDNDKTFESQCEVVGFDDFIELMTNIGWRVTSTDYEARPLIGGVK